MQDTIPNQMLVHFEKEMQSTLDFPVNKHSVVQKRDPQFSRRFHDDGQNPKLRAQGIQFSSREKTAKPAIECLNLFIKLMFTRYPRQRLTKLPTNLASGRHKPEHTLGYFLFFVA